MEIRGEQVGGVDGYYILLVSLVYSHEAGLDKFDR
jgi:hypothetical protein